MKLRNKLVHQKLLCSILIGLVVINAIWMAMIVEPAQAPAPPSLTLKWSRNLGSKGATLVAAQAGDINRDGKMEIVLTSSSSDWSSDGIVTALQVSTDRKSANILWQTTSARIPSIGIDERTPLDLVDLNKDGILEIFIPGLNGPIVLRGNDGSLYWRRTDVGSSSNWGAVADVNGDGYPEIFVSRGRGPQQGEDYITELSYDGNVMKQAWLWHTCWGGLTIGDPKNDGDFVLLQGERSNSYNPNEADQPYKGGGLGARALDANTLTPLWNDPTVLDSSHCPIFADVDGDGVLDVVTASQLSQSVVVYNSTDGSVLTSDGIYRKGGTPRMPAHSQPTVYDVDEDGNLEYITARDTNVTIFDLKTWTLEKTLTQSPGHEPPKLGDINGDGKMDIVAVIGGKRQVSIFTYDKTISDYVEINRISTGISGINAFTLVQDVDGDGKNELVLTSANGTVYCYATSGVPSVPPQRSELSFYNEYKTGAATYVSPPTPASPVFRDQSPRDLSFGQSLNPTLSVFVADFQQNLMTITFRTNASGTWQDIAIFTGVANGVYGVTPTSMNKAGTTYYWEVRATDNINPPRSEVYKFTTRSDPPTQTDPSLNNVGGDLIALNQTTADPDGDKVTNIYDWFVNGVSYANLHLPFDTQTSSNVLVADGLFSDGFENGFVKWDGNGVTNWNVVTNQKHSGSYSAHAGSTSTYLTSDTIDTSYGDGITVGFWYRRHGTHAVNLQFWSGSTYTKIIDLGTSLSTVPMDMWQYYSIQTYSPKYLRQNFRVRIDATALTTGEEFWIDDFTITTPTQAKDYSDYNNNAMIRGATWTEEGIVGGAYVFDGSNDYMKIRDDPSLGGNGTWSEISAEFWIKLNAPVAGATVIAKKVAQESAGGYMIGFRDAGSGSPANTLFWSVTNGTYYDPVRNRTRTSTVSVWDDTNTVLTVGNWYHVVATYKSGQGLTIYINGTQRTNKPLTGNIFVYGDSIFEAPLFIGWDGGTNVNNDRYRWLNGTLDEIMIYPKALTSGQIMQRYLETKDGSSSSSIIVSEETTLGETWRAKVTPNDSFGDGVTRFSNPLTVTEPPVQYELIIDVSGSGTTNPAPGAYTYNSGADVVVAAIPDVGMTLDYWLLDGSDGGDANPITVEMDTDHTLTAVFTQNQYALTVNTVGSGSVTKNPNQATYTYGTVVTLTASPDVGWSFAGWSGDASGFDLTTTVTMTSDKTATATFTQDQYTLTVNIVGTGSVTRDPDQVTYTYGTVVTLTAAPALGWGFGGWSGDVSGSDLTTTVTINGNKAVTATFTQNQYTLTVTTVGQGSVTKDPDQATYTYGTVVTLTASPDQGWSFASWSGGASGFDLTTTVTMTSDKAVTATFTQDQYSLAVTTIGDGSVSKAPDQATYTYGTVVTLTASPNLGWSFSSWSGDASGTELTTTVTMDGNKAVTATFTQNQYTLAVNTVGSGLVTKSPDQVSHTYGAVVTLTASPSLGWSFAGWSGDASGTELTTTVTMTGNKEVTATFTQDEYTLTVNIVGSGSVAKNPDHVTYTYGTVVTLTASPDSGWNFVVWSGDASGSELTTTVTMNGNRAVTATFTDKYTLTVNIVGDGSVTKDPDQIGYAYGTVVTLTATPDLGWSFSSWSGDVTGTDLTITIQMNGNKDVTATFSQDQYTLTVTTVGDGSVTVSPDQATYTYGTVVTLTASPDLGWSFTGWSGDATGADLTTTVTMNGNRAVTATFSEDQYTLSVTIVGDGSVSKTPDQATYTYGTVVTLTATPNLGWSFVAWSGDTSGSELTTTVTIDGNKAVTATFTQNQYTLTVNVDGSGSVSKDPDQATYTYGTVVTLTASPSLGWSFAGWSGDASGTDLTTTVTMDGNKEVTATFTQDEYTLSVTIVGQGSVTKTPDQATYTYGTVVTLTATPDPSWNFVGWSGDASGSELTTTVTMNGNKAVTATFSDQYTLTVNIVGDGSVTRDPDQISYAYGTIVTLTAAPDLGWSFASWGGDASGSDLTITMTMDGNKALTATFTQDQYTLTVTTVGSGSVILSPDQVTFTYGTVVTLTASPDLGWSFTSWSGDASGTDLTTIVTMTSDKALTATFSEDQYTLTVATDGGGLVSKTPDQATYTYGTVVTLTATPDLGWSFVAWSGDVSGTELTATLTMTGNKEVTATFTDQYTLTVATVGNGIVAKDPDQAAYAYGTVVTLTAYPDPGWSFEGWSGHASGTDLTTTVTIDGNKAVTATFTQDQYTLTVNVDGSGSVARNPDQATYTYDNVVTLTASPNLGWSFAGWSGDASGSDLTTTVTMTGNKVVTATFTQDQYTLSVTTVGSGSVTKSPDQATYTYGTVVTLTASPDLGWSFVGWTGDASGTDLTTSVTMAGNKVVTATFTQDQYTLTVTIVGSGSVTKNPDLAYYTYGTVVTLTAVPDSGWSFGGWGGDASGSDLTTTVTMDGNRVATATFTQNEYTLIINVVGNGLVTKNPDQATYTFGTVVFLSASPDLGWSFEGWSGDASGTDLTTTVTMDNDKTVTATFTEDQYTLAVNIVGTGSVTKDPDQATYTYGDIVTLTAAPDAGWSFAGWSGDASGSANPTSVTMTGNKVVTATFTLSAIIFSDGFESGNFANWDSTTTTSGETATVVSSRSHHGSYSGRFTSNGGAGTEQAYVSKAVDVSEVYVRGYFYMDGSLPLNDNGDRFYFIRLLAANGQTGLVYAGIRRDGGVDKWVLYTLNGYTPAWTYAQSPLPQNGAWYSVELHWKLHSNAGVVELYVDGVKIIEVTGVNTAYFGNARRVDFGLVQATGVQKSLIIYADCAVISQSYIGPEAVLLSINLMSTFEGTLANKFQPFALVYTAKDWFGILLLLTLASQTIVFGSRLFTRSKKKRSGIKLQP